MIDGLLKFSIARRWIIMFLVLGISGGGVWNYQRLPIDAVPDITNVQVQVNTSAPGYSPLEVEQRITYLIETAIAGLPGLEYTRSLSRYGLSQVTVIFDDGTDIYFARNLINERLTRRRARCRKGLNRQWDRSRAVSVRSFFIPCMQTRMRGRRMVARGIRPH